MRYRNILLYMALFLALHGTISAQIRERIKFSGFDWYVRKTTEPEGPMNNLFGGLGTSVDTLPDGALRLSVVYRNGTWYSAEVWTTRSLGYGTYTFRVRTPLGQLHPDLILGLFTYSRTLWYHNREIDIEFSAWGTDTERLNGQYVVQPHDKAGHLYAFPAAAFAGPSTQQFTWLSDRIEFSSWSGYGGKPPPGDPRLINSWVFSDAKSIPRPSAPIHMNLYLFESPPSDKKEGSLVVILDGFEFAPAKK
ncbi:MAG: hypothetical protein ABFC85_09115 [Rectinema sp.]|jgi:hypothetical protein